MGVYSIINNMSRIFKAILLFVVLFFLFIFYRLYNLPPAYEFIKKGPRINSKTIKTPSYDVIEAPDYDILEDSKG